MGNTSNLSNKNIPNHIAIIMDGNGRWAKKSGHKRIFGHQHGVKAVRETVETAAQLNVSFLTLFAFSTENWNRPKSEVDALMTLLVKTLKKEIKTLHKNNIQLNAIGDLESLPVSCYKELLSTIKETSSNNGMVVTLALSYSSRWEITRATQLIALKVSKGELDPAEVNQETFEEHLSTNGMPDPELIIRTSGEHRISNFLLWQAAYAEFYFTETLWPDFRKEDLEKAIEDYQKRERRFGKTTEQINPQ